MALAVAALLRRSNNHNRQQDPQFSLPSALITHHSSIVNSMTPHQFVDRHSANRQSNRQPAIANLQ
jgi:hypothetical protein